MADADEPGICRLCGRAALEHASGACRKCRADKPEGWVAPRRKRRPAPRILTAKERAELQPKGWVQPVGAGDRARASKGPGPAPRARG